MPDEVCNLVAFTED